MITIAPIVGVIMMAQVDAPSAALWALEMSPRQKGAATYIVTVPSGALPTADVCVNDVSVVLSAGLRDTGCTIIGALSVHGTGCTSPWLILPRATVPIVFQGTRADGEGCRARIGDTVTLNLRMRRKGLDRADRVLVTGQARLTNLASTRLPGQFTVERAVQEGKSWFAIGYSGRGTRVIGHNVVRQNKRPSNCGPPGGIVRNNELLLVLPDDQSIGGLIQVPVWSRGACKWQTLPVPPQN